ncbi:zinc carboxypeptidase-like [Contarinia nasturtii]|uniref:zinc carboxypeptidase-like n=1 Tax=Contarinia nasturtii TaxID=265458 RepID=UPI0012D45DA5|nr:zinc carboxypeptidase-like [Contarinia nasturtii]
MKLIIVAILFACVVACFSEKARYDNYRVYSIEVENEQQFEVLKRFESGLDGISFLETPTGIQQKAEIIVPPHKFADISELFETLKIKNQIKIANLQKVIDQEQPQHLERSGFGWKQYYDLTAIYAWLDELLEQYPNVLTNYNYGTSYENRTLRAIKVSHKKGNPTIFIESTIHAREWVTQATATYFLNELLTSSDAEIRQLADNYDWVFVPVVNVDGYAYTHSNDRMWRKTRQPHTDNCIGADPNRNFDFHHAEVGASTNPCAETYAGPKPLSEPEILALTEFIKTFDNIKLYISFHSYSQLLLFPYGHTRRQAPNHSDMMQIARKTREAIAKRYKTDYTVGPIATTIYLASGSSIDWVYGTQDVKLSFTFEFRDKGRHGFILPADQIIPNSLEIVDGLKAMVEEAKALKYL